MWKSPSLVEAIADALRGIQVRGDRCERFLARRLQQRFRVGFERQQSEVFVQHLLEVARAVWVEQFIDVEVEVVRERYEDRRRGCTEERLVETRVGVRDLDVGAERRIHFAVGDRELPGSRPRSQSSKAGFEFGEIEQCAGDRREQREVGDARNDGAGRRVRRKVESPRCVARR